MMGENLALFVDAGYLFIQGSLAAFGEKLGRHEIELSGEPFVRSLSEWLCETYPTDEMFRTYWYDGAKGAIPSKQQLDVAALPFVKMRLGRINSAGQQKGVDTLIVRDLMVLSQERSIQRAVVLSGDEDLREGIEYAQDRGVRVAVLGIDASGRSSQSRELVREADQALTLPSEILTANLTRIVVPALTSARTTAASPVEGAAGRSTSPLLGKCVAAAETFARSWTEKATADEIAALVEVYPKIPSVIDGNLLRQVAGACAVYELDEESRRTARQSFWTTIKSVASST